MVAIRQNTIGKNKPTHLVAHLHFCQHTNQTEKCKRATKPTHQQDTKTTRLKEPLPITAVWRYGGCSASYDNFVVGSSAVLRLNFCGKMCRLRQARKR